MTEAQFSALAQILRLRTGPVREAVRLHLVDGLSVAEAAAKTSIKAGLVYKAVSRVRAGLQLAKTVSTD